MPTPSARAHTNPHTGGASVAAAGYIRDTVRIPTGQPLQHLPGAALLNPVHELADGAVVELQLVAARMLVG